MNVPYVPGNFQGPGEPDFSLQHLSFFSNKLCQKRPVMKNFLLTIVLEGLEDKYNLRLCRGMQQTIASK